MHVPPAGGPVRRKLFVIVAVLSTYNFDAGTVEALPGPRWLREARLGAWETFATSALPTESEEIWRYSRIGQLDIGRYLPIDIGRGAGAAVSTRPALGDLGPVVAELVGAGARSASILLLDAAGKGELAHPQHGLSVSPYGDGPMAAGVAARLGGPPPEPWVALNAAMSRTPWRVEVAAGATVAEPLVIVHWLAIDGAMVFPRTEIVVGEQASATVVELFISPDCEMLSVPVADISLGAGSRLQFAQVQLLGPRVWQLANQTSTLSRDAALLAMTVATGGYYARARTSSVLAGPGGESELLAGYFGTGEQMHDLRTIQHHAAPRSRSALLFKGAVAQSAHSVYSGLIRVEKGAKGTNAFQTNRNLVLSEGAQADSVPNLEIEDNDVRCSHASAVGPIDESQLFYLESRGVPTDMAQRLITLGFMDEVLERFPVGPMRPGLRSLLSSKLSGAGFAPLPIAREQQR